MNKKKNNKHQTLCIEEITKELPILTESEMNNLCTYEEILNDALIMFDEKVKNIIQTNDSN